jgi:hypothetical protein
VAVPKHTVPSAASTVGVTASTGPRTAAAFPDAAAPNTISSICFNRVHLKTSASLLEEWRAFDLSANSGRCEDDELADNAERWDGAGDAAIPKVKVDSVL